LFVVSFVGRLVPPVLFLHTYSLLTADNTIHAHPAPQQCHHGHHHNHGQPRAEWANSANSANATVNQHQPNACNPDFRLNIEYWQQKKSLAARKRGRKNNVDRVAVSSANKNASASMSLSSSAVVTVATKMRNDSSASALLAASSSTRGVGSSSSSRSRLFSKVMGQTYADLSPGKRLAKSYSFDYEDISSRDAIACSKLPPSDADRDRGVEILADSENAATFDDVHGYGSAEIHEHQMSYDELCDHSNRGEYE
jgi:hypothetical protein